MDTSLSSERSFDGLVPELPMSSLNSRRTNQAGFTLVELVAVCAILMIIVAAAFPLVARTMDNIKLRYSASDLSGILQRCRIQAVRRNSPFAVATTVMPDGSTAFFVDLNQNVNPAYAAGDPLADLPTHSTPHLGTGSGAPNEGALTAALGFPVNASTTALPAFNARGLPCTYAGGAATCPVTNTGYIYFINDTGISGNANWAAIAISPSGRVQTWIYQPGNNIWVKQ